MFVLGSGVATFAIATPYRYGAWLDPTATMAIGGLTLNYGAGLLLALIHVAKVTLVAAIVPAWRRSALAGSMGVAISILLVGLSVWNAVALFELQRSARVTDAGAAAERADIARSELKTVGERLKVVGWKPLATVNSEIAAERHDWRWDATSGCTKVANGGQRLFCARLAHLEAARATAAEAERLHEREAELRRQLSRQPGGAESQQPDLAMLAAWLDISLRTAEILRTLFWAAVIEVAEIGAFGFASFFWSTAGARVSATKAEHAPASAIANSNADKVSVSMRDAPLKSDRGRRAGRTDRESTGRRAGKGPRPWGEPSSASREVGVPLRAVHTFVATLSRGPDLRAAGADLLEAYKGMQETRGWPRIAPNVFGQLLKQAVEAVGGCKLKASRQFYVGVGLPL